ncbi:autophagy protein Atg8 ubiquitin like protein [Tricharina praecox]|uniref:autophagy protein Atg8 ubiquitin like protein n=1 Tax=Tricharina praecox TaxID=43433 RepID=UPI00221F6698|nr:autophagy protein Atg8 ubiquitin like protein [Tricharina praecox]KAI5858878.1 autophagy protein Atg8 ubiquitin like protein [Tricharina praecox]
MLEHARSTQRHRLELVSSVFLCPPDLRLSEFMYNVRRKTKMPANIAVFLMADGLLVSLATTMGELYQQARDDDGWLYIVWTEESTFGCA